MYVNRASAEKNKFLLTASVYLPRSDLPLQDVYLHNIVAPPMNPMTSLESVLGGKKDKKNEGFGWKLGFQFHYIICAQIF